MIAGGTGHRDLTQEQFSWAVDRLVVCFRAHGITLVRSGGAIGWDYALIYAASICGIPFALDLPVFSYRNRWPAEWKKRWEEAESRAVEVIHHGANNLNLSYDKRNRAIVDKSHQIYAGWDSRNYGGTFNAVKYAFGAGKPILRMCPQTRIERWIESLEEELAPF